MYDALVLRRATIGHPLIHCTDKTKTAFPHIHLPFRKRSFAEKIHPIPY